MHRFILILLSVLLSLTALNASATNDKKHPSTAKQNVSGILPDALPGKAQHDLSLRVATITINAGVESNVYIGHHNDRYREGIDVSHYQGKIDWNRVAREGGVSYVYIKATEGAEIVDDRHAFNLAAAHKAGLSVGSYHFYRPRVDVDAQFRNMTSVVIKSGQDLVPIIDIEDDRGVTEDRFIADLSRFIHMVTRHYGRKPMLYTGQNFYNKHFQGLFQDYQWMIAKYKPDVPVLEDGRNYLMWQYTDKGRIPGINGNVDRSCLMGSGTLKKVLM